MSLTQKLEVMQRRHAELSALLGEADTMADATLFTRLSREYSELDPVVNAFQALSKLEQEAQEAALLATTSDGDPDLKEMAREESALLKEAIAEGWQNLQIMLLPPDPDDGKNVILEIRAGTGGAEAGLFAADLFRMYGRFAEEKGWRLEILSSSGTALGGFKEVIAILTGKGAFSSLKFESGVHRVQRVPVTEAGGRIHTSACTVAVLPEADEVDIHINEKEDLRVDVFRSSGPGGQSVNTTDSAIRLTHLPSGLVVICQDEKSQHKNKAKALKVLKARLYDLERQASDDARSQRRRDQVGSGDRSERIRTYNFPQNRVTDHRIQLTLHKLDKVLEGGVEEIISALATHNQAAQLAALGASREAPGSRPWGSGMAAKLLSLFLVGLLWIAAPAAAGKYRQPAYISNAYFSDKMSEEGDVVRPRSVAKALRARTTGVVGYFILDLVLTTQGTHLFKVNIINNAGEKTTDLIYAPVSAPPGEELPLYTAAGAISGEFAPGIWFFKVYDRVDDGLWHHLGAFSIMILDPKTGENGE